MSISGFIPWPDVVFFVQKLMQINRYRGMGGPVSFGP